ncbi:ZP domain-containing protein-like [Sardina pilchardus]|uniref:ZP domain-containing protein-like n=1 Tax=Sardina pilchardus TaxID=27697 RepID=UPI002E15FA99
MRCVVVEVEHHQFVPEANVICTENFMAIELETSISESIQLHVDHLRLNDPSCTLYSNGTHVFANMSLNTCGTTVEEDQDSLFFKNEIVSFDNQSNVITRINQVEFQFFCKYPKRSNVTLEFDTHRGPYAFVQKGFGTFSYQFEFFHSSQFQYRRDPNSYPLEYSLGEMMYMQIEGMSSVNNTELFVESCKASPSDDPQAHTSYTIIENGCKKDETVKFYSNHDNKVKFGMKAFKFIGWYDQVFITCSVILCEAGNPNTRCSQGCTNATASPAVHHHHRREAPIQTTSHYISQGPVRLGRSADTRDAPSTVLNNGLNMNLVVIAGCLLMVSAVIYTKRPKIVYQPLPISDF